MLVHITMTHTPDECPGYNPELIQAMVDGDATFDETMDQVGITVHGVWWSIPEHVAFALVEIDDMEQLAPFAAAFPMKQDFKVTLVKARPDVINMAKRMLSQQGG